MDETPVFTELNTRITEEPLSMYFAVLVGYYLYSEKHTTCGVRLFI